MLRRRAVLALVMSAAGLLGVAAEAGADVDDTFADGGWYVTDQADRVLPVPVGDGTTYGVAVKGGAAFKSVVSVVKLDAAGDLVPGFGQGGEVQFDLAAGSEFPEFEAHVSPGDRGDGLIEPAGAVMLPGGRLAMQFPSSVGNYLVVMHPDGSLDRTFSGNGLAADTFCGRVADLAFDATRGALVSVAFAQNSDPGCGGTTVRDYGLDGRAIASTGQADGTVHDGRIYAGSVVVDSAGRVLVAGAASGGAAVLRLTAAGTPDPSFGSAGLAHIALADVPYEPYFNEQYHGFSALMSNQFASDLALDAAGRVVIVGGTRATAQGSVDLWVARFLPSGVADPSFDGDGKALLDRGAQDQWGISVMAGPGSAIVVSGADRAPAPAGGQPGPRQQFVVRLLHDGQLDTSTGHGGWELTRFGTGHDVVAHDAVMVAPGRVLVAGLDYASAAVASGYIGAIDLDGSGGGGSTSSTSSPSTSTSSTTTSTTPSTTTPTTPPPVETVPADFTPIAPVRALDTREVAHGAAPVVAGRDRDVSLAPANPPPGAIAAAVNLTVTEPSHAGFASAFPAGSAWPGTSTVNHEAGQTIANSVVVKVSTDHRLTLRVGAGSAHLVLDVQGWYTAAGFVAVEPSRQFDTRVTGTRMGTEAATVALAGVPEGATAVAVNLTVTAADAPSYLTAWAAGGTESLTSVLNHGPGLTVANGVIVPLGAGGGIQLRNAAGQAHVVVDVMGWVVGDAYHAVAPERVVDTRGVDRPLSPGETRTFDVRPTEAVELGADVASVVVNLTVTEPSAATFLSAWPAGGTRSMTSVLNAVAGQTIANGLVLAVEDGQLSVYNNLGRVHVVVDVLGWYPAT